MQEDTDFIGTVRDYIVSNPSAKAVDIVEHFYSLGIPKEKTLNTLWVIIGA